jgi:uncharacterized protein (TIGR03118 family)
MLFLLWQRLLRHTERQPRTGAGVTATASPRRARRHPARPSFRPRLEGLEERVVPVAPTVFDPSLGVRTVVSGLTTPTSMTFLGDNDFFVLEKNTGKVDHVINGVVAPTKFDFGAGPVNNLPVNFNSERGLLGVTLSPDFANDHFVYLYWTENNSGPAPDGNVADVPLLGNRVDRFVWSPVSSTLTFDRNIIRLHAFQNDGNGGNPAQMQGNHNGGVIKFGPDGKLYIVIGDNGRRGWMQNLIDGPNGPGQTDENNGPVRGGPAPDDAHLTGVLLRLNPDGSTPDDNPFSDIRNTLGSVLTGADGTPLGSFTAFLNQEMDTLTVTVSFQGLSGPTLKGGADIRFGGPDGPVILHLKDFPAGLTSGQFTTTLTKRDFKRDNHDGIKTFDDAVKAILNGQASFDISTGTKHSGDGEISGQIAQLDPSITNNLHKIFAYGIRNTFGFDWDPLTGKLWLEENGDISFDKISIVGPGADDGWIQSSAPLFNTDGTFDDVALQEFRSIELTAGAPQQTRWPSANIADTPEEALNRLVMFPGAFYNKPVFSVRAEFPPAALSFFTSSALGSQYQNALFEGGARDLATSGGREIHDGALFVFQPNSSRTGLDFGGDPNVRTTDNVFLNDRDFDLMGDTSFLFGEGFGIGTAIVTGPNGDMFVVSETKGAVYEIFRKDAVAAYSQTNLVSSLASPPGGAPEVVDTSLKNPWGISFSSTSPFWVADQRTGVSTLYAGDHLQPDGTVTPITKNSLTVTIPPRAGGTQGSPTGTVFNATTDFVLSNGQPARFIFDGLDGTITAWNGGTTAELKATVAGASYTGLAIGTSSSGGNFLYAANQATGKIDVFDANFQLTTLGPGGNFEDPNLPPGSPFRAFNVQNINGTLYVTYDKVVTSGGVTDREHDGIVDAFDTDGHFLRRVVTGGVNAPWGVALAPDNFGAFSGALLIGNFGFGDGKINAYNPDTGAFLGNLTDANGQPLAIEGLWALAFGNGGNAGDPNALYFAAGINRTGANSFGAADGLFGSLRPT